MQCRNRFSWVWAFFAEKVILVLKCNKITSLELLETPILCLVQISKLWECEVTDAQKLSFSVRKKLLNAILRAKLNYNEKYIFLMKLNCFLQCRRTDFHEFELFCRKSHFKCLNAQKITSLELLRTTNSVFSANKQLWECEVTDAQKLLSQSEKVAKCNFKSKAQLHEKLFF